MFRKIMKNKSIFSYLLVVMCILVLIETTILVGSLSTGGMFAKLNQNAKDIVDQRVINIPKTIEAIKYLLVNKPTEKIDFLVLLIFKEKNN